MVILLVTSCYPNESLNSSKKDDVSINSELDQYIQDNFIKEYGIAVRYKFDEKYVTPGQRVTPPRLEVIRPMLDFIEEFWIDPYLEVPGGEAFFRRYVPSEVVLLGGLIYNGDGTVTLGVADAGARITFTNVNAINPSDSAWRQLQLRTTYHEFAHIVHQEFKLPPSFETITQSGYSGPGSWFTLTDEDALQRGFVSPYATSSVNEDFAEMVAFYLYDSDFFERFINLEEGCVTAECEANNTGRERIAEKLASISDHYTKVTGLDLNVIRAEIQSRLPQ
ncbi:MAG: substrate import-associated zinc metallohydrolase lipoprotein [Bacteroidota bacterium]